MGTLRLRALVIAALLGGCAAPADAPPAIAMADVTIAWPLPDTTDDVDDGFLTAADGALPRAWFDQVPRLTRTDEPDALYDGMLVVGARLDPCFREGGADAPCRATLRLVLQPVLPAPTATTDTPSARDASAHVFFDVDTDEVLAAVRALAALRDAAGHDGSGRLGVHPLLHDGDGRRAVADVIAPLLRAERLSRVTSMGVHGADTAWTMSGFDVVDGAAAPIAIGAAGGVTEQHVLSDGDDAIHASVQPPLEAADDITLLLDDAVARAAARADREAAFAAATRIEDPRRHDPGTIDCVSCHLAGVARAAALAREPDLTADAYANDRHDLTPSVYEDTRMVRAFGWRYRELALSARVVNESAAVADLVDGMLREER